MKKLITTFLILFGMVLAVGCSKKDERPATTPNHCYQNGLSPALYGYQPGSQPYGPYNQAGAYGQAGMYGYGQAGMYGYGQTGMYGQQPYNGMYGGQAGMYGQQPYWNPQNQQNPNVAQHPYNPYQTLPGAHPTSGYNPANVGCIGAGYGQPYTGGTYPQITHGGVPYYAVPGKMCSLDAGPNEPDGCGPNAVCQKQPGLYVWSWNPWGSSGRQGVCQPIVVTN